MFGGQAFNFGGERDPFCVRQGGGGEDTCRQCLGEYRRQLCVYWDRQAICGKIRACYKWGNTDR